MFVISIKRLFDYLGNKLEKPEYEYFGYDRYAGSFSTGYPTWMDFYQAETFKTAEQAKKGLHGKLTHSCLQLERL